MAMPPPLTPVRLLTAWTFDPAMLVPLAVAGVLYVWAIRVLRRKGEKWSRRRTTAWFAGLAIIFLGTSSSMGVYDRTLFMMPALQHMLLQMIAPAPLVLAAPMTLLLRALPKRPRKLFLSVVHSRPARFIAHPVVAYLIFAVNQFIYYYTPLYGASLRNIAVHDLVHWHFVLVGFLFYWSLLGVDPIPHRVPFLFRFLLVVGLGPVHVLLGIPIMMMSTLIAGDYYLGLGRSWGVDPFRDQYIGGGILWVFGDVAAAVLIVGLVRQWYRSDQREARRTDRQIDRLYGTAQTTTPWWLAENDSQLPESPLPQPDSEYAGGSGDDGPPAYGDETSRQGRR